MARPSSLWSLQSAECRDDRQADHGMVNVQRERIPAVVVHPLRFQDWLPGRGCWTRSVNLQGREKAAPGWGVSSMTGKSRHRESSGAGTVQEEIQENGSTYLSSHLETECLTLVSCPVCEVMELGRELRHSSWAPGIWIWIPRSFPSCIRTDTCSPNMFPSPLWAPVSWSTNKEKKTDGLALAEFCHFANPFSYNLF